MTLFCWMEKVGLLFFLVIPVMIIFISVWMYSVVPSQYSDIKTMIYLIQSVHNIFLLADSILLVVHMFRGWKNMKGFWLGWFKLLKMMIVAGTVYTAAILTHLVRNDYFYREKTAKVVYTLFIILKYIF